MVETILDYAIPHLGADLNPPLGVSMGLDYPFQWISFCTFDRSAKQFGYG
jgi:hypothetical protein